MDGPLKSRALSGSGSAHWELRLTSYAGAVAIDNGKHRAAGALAWLLRPGASGRLRAALTVVRQDCEGRVASVLALVDQGTLEVARLTAPRERAAVENQVGVDCEFVLRVQGGRDALALPVGWEPARKASEPKVPFGAGDDVVRWNRYKWTPLPDELVRAWRDAAWMQRSVEAGTKLASRPAAEFVSPL